MLVNSTVRWLFGASRADSEHGNAMITTQLEERDLTGWGLRNRAWARVATPTSTEEIVGVFTEARSRGETVGLRGGGNSYGDAALNDRQVILCTPGLNRTRAWD